MQACHLQMQFSWAYFPLGFNVLFHGVSSGQNLHSSPEMLSPIPVFSAHLSQGTNLIPGSG